MSTIKLSRIVFEGPIQVAGMTVREYVIVDGQPARYDAHLHAELQCITMRDPSADLTIYIPLRCVRSMEAYDKHQLSAGPYTERPASDAPSDYAEPSEEVAPKRRGRPRTKQLGSPGDNL